MNDCCPSGSAVGGAGVLTATEPPSYVLRPGVTFPDWPAVTSLCTVIAFFCSEDHLEAWRHTNYSGATGCRLALDEALQVGRALFAPVLRPATADNGRTE